MLPSVLTTIFFALSAVFASRSVRVLGGARANFWRLVVGTLLLGIWAHAFGQGVGGTAFPVFLLSGFIGFGIGDTAYFKALPHLGPRLCLLIMQCLAAPLAALAEWVWLGTTMTRPQVLFGAVALIGVGIALAPTLGPELRNQIHGLAAGLIFGVIAAAGQGLGAVVARRAYAAAKVAGEQIDGGSAAYQRILGGLGVAGLIMAWQWKKERGTESGSRSVDRKSAWGWVLANSLAGSVFGVSCYQWALRVAGTGLVLPIVATAPIVVIPFSYALEGERPSMRSILGGVIGVVGVIGLTLSR